jgi:hypothetical protein
MTIRLPEFVPPPIDPADDNPLHTHFRAWGAHCRDNGDFLAGAEVEGADGPVRPLGRACPNCDQDRWFVIPTPEDDEWSEQQYCQCCGYMGLVWRP